MNAGAVKFNLQELFQNANFDVPHTIYCINFLQIKVASLSYDHVIFIQICLDFAMALLKSKLVLTLVPSRQTTSSPKYYLILQHLITTSCRQKKARAKCTAAGAPNNHAFSQSTLFREKIDKLNKLA